MQSTTLKVTKPTRKPTDQVEEGEVLAESVSDDQGNVLLASGVVLEMATIRLLARRGIDEVVVAPPGAKDADPETITTELTEEQRVEIERERQRLKLGFSRVEDDPVMRKLYSVSMNYLQSLISNSESA